MSKFKVGDKVAVKVAKEAYYSNYGQTPYRLIEEGRVGIVKAVDVPSPTVHNSVFNCVDFEAYDSELSKGDKIHGNHTVRGAFKDCELKLLRIAD